MDRLATVAIVVAVLATASSALHVGGLGPAIPLTAPECRQGDFGASDCHANVTKIIQNERSNIANMANATFTEFRPISYRAQVVSGMVYYAKVQVGNASYVHAEIWQHAYNLSSNALEYTVVAVQSNMTLSDDILPIHK